VSQRKLLVLIFQLYHLLSQRSEGRQRLRSPQVDLRGGPALRELLDHFLQHPVDVEEELDGLDSVTADQGGGIAAAREHDSDVPTDTFGEGEGLSE
jgi:hypothetical protein